MFLRWTNARLKAAAKALDAGRIDDAYQRLASAEVRHERQAQELLEALGRALLARARLHVHAGRYPEALADLERLRSIGRLDAEAAALHQRAAAEQRDRAARQAQRAQAYDRVVRDIQAGHLESGHLALDALADAPCRERLREELDLRVQRSGQLLAQARGLLAAGDALAACRFWEEACQRHGRTSESDMLATELAAALRKDMDDAFDAGRLDRFCALAVATAALRPFSPALTEFEHLAGLTRRAAERLAARDYAGLREALLRLQAAAGETGWLKAALRPVDEIERAQAQLLASPLGALGSSLHKTQDFGKGDSGQEHHTGMRAPEAAARGAELHAGVWLLLVDGTGSALLVTQDLVRIGRPGAPGAVEVPMPADIQSHHADLIRDGEDYFLVAHGPVQVNQQPVRRVLLRHGDRIVLGPKAKMVFHKPTAKSATAVLRLANSCRLAQDVSLVVLLAGTCLLGPQPGCHLMTREGDTRLVLFDRGGELFVRHAARDGRPTGAAAPLPADTTCDFGDVRLTVKRYLAGDLGGRA